MCYGATYTIDKVKCFQVNARSLINKMDEMKCYVYELKPDIVMITESWATEEIEDVVLKLDSYTIIRNDRTGKKGGGCIIYLNDCLRGIRNEDLTFMVDTETVWCDLKTKGGKTLIGVCYHSPSAGADQERALHDLLRRACDRKEATVICGDFNHMSIDWRTLQAGAEGESFVELVQDCFLTQHVDCPTRGDNILDLVLTSEENMIENLVVREPLGTSDHNIITFDLMCSIEVKDWKEEYYDYRNSDFEGMRQFLAHYDWKELIKANEIEGKWSSFKMVMDEIVEKFVPKKTRRKSK